jgi:CheY-like chemotaxis protein
MLDEPFSVAVSCLQGVRVLIVEDSWYIAKAVESVFEDVEMVIAGATATASVAERFARKRAPKVAVVDVKLRDGMAFGLTTCSTISEFAW